MGEYAEMMLDGTCCSSCGEYLGSENGFATQCAGCGGGYPNENRKPKGKIRHKTKRVLLEMHASKKQTEMKFGVNSAQIFSLMGRGLAEDCKRMDYYQLTDAGHAEAERILASKSTPSQGKHQ